MLSEMSNLIKNIKDTAYLTKKKKLFMCQNMCN